MLLYTVIFGLTVLSHEVFCQNDEGDSCLDAYTNTIGRCTLVERCRSAIEDFQKNGIRPTNCRYTINSVLVCCRDGSNILQTPRPETQSRPAGNRLSASYNRRAGIISKKKCREYSASVTETFAFVPLVTDPEEITVTAAKCDYSGTELIVGGEDAKQGEFPHMAAIGWSNSNGGYDFNCGGALISPRFVLSAAHCTYFPSANNPAPDIVRLGDQNLNPRVRDGADPVEVPIKNVVKHPNYKSPKRYNDIALFELATDVDFSDTIRPACLWTEPDFGDNTKALATGWGVTNSETNQKSDVLQKVSLSIMDNVFCNESLSDIISRRWDHGFEDTQMCAGELREGKDTCQGDSGSPLQIVAEENQCIFKVIGITSFGPKTCGNQPAVYTKVSSYISWIEPIVWPGE